MFLQKLIRQKKGLKVIESDHNPIITEFNLSLKDEHKEEKIEVFNLKNQECQLSFKKYTSNTKMLSSVFDSNEDIEVLTNRFMKKT